MDAARTKRWKELADLIAIEQDGDKFSALIAELTRLLDEDEARRRAPIMKLSGGQDRGGH